jgi:MFS family permease
MANDAALTGGARVRSLAAILSSVFAAGLTIGLTQPLVALNLAAWGEPAWIIGLNSAMWAVANMLVGPLMPRVIGRLGVMPALYAGIAVAVGVIALFPLLPYLAAWFVLRFVLGAALGLHWVVSETWINRIAGDASRGRVAAIYVTVLSIGFAGGPLLIEFVGIEGTRPFLYAAGLILLSALPLLLARGMAPEVARTQAADLRLVAGRAPLVMITALIGGMTDAAAFVQMPIFALHHGVSDEVAVRMLSAFLAGGVALQFPIGWLSDHFPRRRVLALIATAGLGGALLLPFAVGTAAVWPLLFVWGGIIVGLYTVGLAVLGESFAPHELAGANVIFVMLYSGGSVLGPVAAGAAIDVVGPNGLPMVMASAALALLVLLMVPARSPKQAPPVAPPPSAP